MIEKHPMPVFVPAGAEYLILGSFATKPSDNYDWFYGNSINQFWPILESIYKTPLKTKTEKQELFRSLGIAITDIILECERIKNSNLDKNLKILKYNNKAIEKILKENKIKRIFFTSRFVEKLYKRICKKLVNEYPDIRLTLLPSPSPRYASLSKEKKVKTYKNLLPKKLIYLKYAGRND